MPEVRRAAHAGSWYKSKGPLLNYQLGEWLNLVPRRTVPIGTASSQAGPVDLQDERIRAVIAPHAGYTYSGPAAAWAYQAIQWATVDFSKRVFLLGPSHHYYLTGAATTGFSLYDTPNGRLLIDTKVVGDLVHKHGFEVMSSEVDEEEHSLEMHLPYIYKMLADSRCEPAEGDDSDTDYDVACIDYPALVPIMIGNLDGATERRIGQVLAPYLADPGNIFIISSDFCHWGARFRYTYYQPSSGPAIGSIKHINDVSERPIHESIAAVDQESMDAVESGISGAFWEQLRRTGNTVCGRHPIGVFLAAVETSDFIREKRTRDVWAGRFRFIKYERNTLVSYPRESSVSYASALAYF